MPDYGPYDDSLEQLYLRVGRMLGYGSMAEWRNAVAEKGVQGAMDTAPGRSGVVLERPADTKAGNGWGKGWDKYSESLVQSFMDKGLPRAQAVAVASRFYTDQQALVDSWAEQDNNPGEMAYNWVNAPELADKFEKWGREWEAANPTVKTELNSGVTGTGQTDSTDTINDDLYKWVQSMSGPVDPNDPVVRGLEAVGTNAAQRDARNRGVYGGLSGMNVQTGAQQAVLPYLQQRPQLALQGLGALSQRDLNLRNISVQQLQAENAAIAQKNAADAANFGAQQNSASSTGSLIGGIIGAIPGIIAAPYTGGASLGLIGAGSAIGGGVGGMTAGSAPQMRGFGSRPSYTGYSPSGGSGGSNGGSGF